MKIPIEEFSMEIAEAMDRLPKFLRREADKAGVAVIPEDRAPGKGRGGRVFAHFIGPTAKDFAMADSPHPPTIVMYRSTFESACASREILRDEIYRTLVHELGHFLGLDEGDLKDV